MSSSCHSCGMPLTGESAKNNYCQYCADENGNLHPFEQVQQGIAQWLEGWAPQGTQADFRKRAAHYMKAMPAWAHKS